MEKAQRKLKEDRALHKNWENGSLGPLLPIQVIDAGLKDDP